LFEDTGTEEAAAPDAAADATEEDAEGAVEPAEGETGSEDLFQ
jgi:hypothetical protein